MKTRNFATTTFTTIAEEGFIYGLPIVLSVPEVEKEIGSKLASIGVGPDKTFDFKDLSMEHKATVLLGIYGNGEEEAMYPKCLEDADGSRTAPKMAMVKQEEPSQN